MDAYIDPTTKDYVLLDSGAVQADPSGGLLNACYMRLSTPLGTYFDDPNLGSLLHLLQREKDVSRVQVLAKQYAEQALAPLVKDQRAQSITVTTSQPGNGRLYLLIDVVAASGQKWSFKHPVQVG